jgi:hypothetical protein
MKKESHIKNLLSGLRLYLFFFLCQHHKVSKKGSSPQKNRDKKSEMSKIADSLAHAHAYFWI